MLIKQGWDKSLTLHDTATLNMIWHFVIQAIGWMLLIRRGTNITLKQKITQIIVDGFENTKYIIYVGLKLMAYKSHQGHIFTNSEELEIKSWTDSTLTLINDDKKQLKLI